MLRLLVLSVLLATTVNVHADDTAGIDIGKIISGLNENAVGLLKNVAIPALNKQVSLIKGHIDGLMAFFKNKEGDIDIPNTSFTIHYKAEACTFMGKRLLLVDFQKCKAHASESQTGLSATCDKGSQADAIECATEKVINLVKLVSIALKKNGGGGGRGGGGGFGGNNFN